MTKFRIIRTGMILAGIINIVGVLMFSKVFTNKTLFETDPAVSGIYGLVIIILWGLTYMLSAYRIESVPRLLLAFALEKLVYTVFWLIWMQKNASSLGEVYQSDFFAGVFQSVYGINDFLFMLFFLWAYRILSK